ncbi:hypothetical protein DL89DRAFT_263949 [Linderina pennispora]|uniref:Fanconi Anaemia group E protein C-terminal domain-containing protein n=1 Tax=Linderina pennispora TaxID=61395 RepID=A0A1Y1WK71_9FUNG|nr:uncharacterized protein DL89DRAFT_263949 [Linderina pennispora]ORX73937.1 hypothetical protein DL89DRAFT_263949 [Linderina pennispora]
MSSYRAVAETDPDPWGAVVQYLKETRDPSETTRYTLCSDVQLSSPLTNPPFVGRATPLQLVRQQQHLEKAPEAAETQSSEASDDMEDISWAIEMLSAITDYDAAIRVWQLPNATLRRVCDAGLDVHNASGPALAQFIKSVLSNSAVSLENQHYLLGRAAASEWFSSQQVIPAVVHSQLSAMLSTQSMTIAQGLIAKLIEEPGRLTGPAAGLAVKLLKAVDMPMVTVMWVLGEVVAVAKKNSRDFADNDALWTIAEAAISALPSDAVSGGCGLGARWAEMLHVVVPANSRSRKLSVCMLHFVNKFGGQLTSAELDQTVCAAGVLATPLKKSIVSAANRKRAK